MDLRKLKTLIELVESSGIAELEISEGEERVRITRALPAAGQQVPMHATPAPSPALTSVVAGGAQPAPAPPAEVTDGGDVLPRSIAGRQGFCRSR